MKLRCLIVDDEELARTLLATYIGRLPQLELVASCKGALEALNILQQQPVDLMFLDIQMPELTGTEMLRTLQYKPMVVFTTAYAEFALEGYALNVADYLLKPIGFERFVQAVNKVAERLKPIETMVAPGQNNTADFLLVKSEHRLHRIRLEDILYMEGMREYVAFYTVSEGRILSLQSLKQLEETLPADRFIRVHKSYIVAASRVSVMEGNQVVIGKVKIPVGASYKEEVMRRLFRG